MLGTPKFCGKMASKMFPIILQPTASDPTKVGTRSTFFLLLAALALIPNLLSCGNPSSPSSSSTASPASTDPITLDYATTTVDSVRRFAPGIIATAANNEFSIAFGPDGRTAYFVRRLDGQKQKIYRTDFREGQWSTPQVAPFSTDRDESPSITPDGQTFFFGSERAISDQPNLGGFDMNIWQMQKQGDGWGPPQALPAPINAVQIAGEQWPSSNASFFYTADNERFYFSTMRRGERAIKIYETHREGTSFSPPTAIEGLFASDQYWTSSPVLSPDGQFLLFNAYDAPGGRGGEDLFVAQRVGEGWSRAKPLGDQINSAAEEANPTFSRDGKYFFFARDVKSGPEAEGIWSIYYLETAYLGLDQLFD